MKVNVNQTVKVKLTKLGRDVLAQASRQDLDMVPDRVRPKLEGLYVKHVEPDGTYSCQLWCLMDHFGPSMVIGSLPLFEDNLIEFVDGPYEP